MLGKEASARFVGLAEIGLEKGIERGVQHSDDLSGLIVDNGVELLVPEDRDSVSANVVGIGLEVKLLEGREAVERIGSI